MIAPFGLHCAVSDVIQATGLGDLAIANIAANPAPSPSRRSQRWKPNDHGGYKAWLTTHDVGQLVVDLGRPGLGLGGIRGEVRGTAGATASLLPLGAAEGG